MHGHSSNLLIVMTIKAVAATTTAIGGSLITSNPDRSRASDTYLRVSSQKLMFQRGNTQATLTI